MIVYSKERYLPSISNVSILSNNEGFFYVYQDTYDDCVILTYKYAASQLINIIDRRDNVNSDIVEKVGELLPRPLSILAPFLLLVDTKLNTENIEEICGCLSVISTSMSLLKYIETEDSIRRRIAYSEGVLTEYELPWKKFFTTAYKGSEIDEISKPAKIYPKEEMMQVIPVWSMNGMTPQMQQPFTQEEVKPSSSENNSKEPEIVGNMVYFSDDDDSDTELKFETLDSTFSKEKSTDEKDIKEGALDGSSDIAGFDARKDAQEAKEYLQEVSSRLRIR